MEEQVLRLCKRLKNFPLEEIEPILNIENLKNILQKFVAENILSFQNGRYFYTEIKNQNNRQNLPLKFQYHSPETINMIIKCFCADLHLQKTANILELSRSCICDFHYDFRLLLYEKQLKKLEILFKNTPKIHRMRKPFGYPVYFYYYDKNTFISEKRLYGGAEKNYTKIEKTAFKVVYNKVYNELMKNHTQKRNVHLHIAEILWRRGKSFEQLKYELCELLGV